MWLQHHIMSEEPRPRQAPPTDSQGYMRPHLLPVDKVGSWQLICLSLSKLGCSWSLAALGSVLSAVRVVGAAPLAAAKRHVRWLCPRHAHRGSPGLHCAVVAPLAAAICHLHWLCPRHAHRGSQGCTMDQQRCGAWPELHARSARCQVKPCCALNNTPCHWGLRHIPTDSQGHTLQVYWRASKLRCW